MIINRLIAKNWRNFREIDVHLSERQFIVGANASGKSNLLDIFRFLRDIVKPEGGGFQKAVKDRGGLSKIRSLAARKDSEVAIEIHLADDADSAATWRYSLGFQLEPRGYRRPYLTHERVWKNGDQLLDRPDPDDETDRDRLTQTSLEQINVNAEFRDIARFLQTVTYQHLVPQLLRYADSIQGKVIEDDPFGQGFLERVASITPKTRRSRLKTIEEALKVAVPQLEQLEFIRDDITGRPHLQALYSHWRPKAGWQREDQFSDGTLRLLGLLWTLLESESVLLLEEPELSLNAAIVSQLAALISKMQRRRRRQVFVSTHSDALLADPGIDGGEVLLLTLAKEGTSVEIAADIADVKPLLEEGLTVADIVLSRTKPEQLSSLSIAIPDSVNKCQAKRKEKCMNKIQLQKRAVMLIDQLSLEDLKTVINYLTNLKNRETTEELTNDSESAKSLKPEAAGKNPIAQRIIDAVEKSYDVTLEDAEALLQVIKENQQPMQFKSPFDVNERENQ